MPAVFKKLNLKDQTEILVINAPESVEPELDALEQVAIDEDWSALRFRRVEFIRTMTRKRCRQSASRGRSEPAVSSRWVETTWLQVKRTWTDYPLTRETADERSG